MKYTLEPIAILLSPFKEKFSTPRQPGLAPSVHATIEFNPEFATADAVRGLEGFSHLCLAMMGPGDTAIVPEPAFPIHNYAVALAGGNVISVPLGCDQDFLKAIAYVCEQTYYRTDMADAAETRGYERIGPRTCRKTVDDPRKCPM